MSYGSTNELFQSRLINEGALTEIYRPRFFRLKAGIEELMRIFYEYLKVGEGAEHGRSC